jgi:hypothetical protein
MASETDFGGESTVMATEDENEQDPEVSFAAEGNNDSNVSMSLDTNGAQTSIDSNFTENMNNYFGIAIGSKKKHESKIPTNQLEYGESLRMNIIDLYRESSLVEEYLLNDGFINGGDGFTLVPFYYSEDNSVIKDFDSRGKVMCFAKEWVHTGEGEDTSCCVSEAIYCRIKNS